MKRVIVLCACIVITAGILAGCGGGGLSADVSTVKVDRKGKVTSLSVESFEKDYYSKEDLESFITKQVEDYVSQNPESEVEVKDISVDDQTAKTLVEYADCEEYASFYNTEFYAGTVVQARAAGYGFDVDFYEASDTSAENTADVSSIINEDDYNTVITNERINVKVDGKILYVSDPTAVLVSEDTIELPVDESKAEGTHKTLVYIIYK